MVLGCCIRPFRDADALASAAGCLEFALTRSIRSSVRVLAMACQRWGVPSFIRGRPHQGTPPHLDRADADAEVVGHGHFRFAPHRFDQITAENDRAAVGPLGGWPGDRPIAKASHGYRAADFAKQFSSGAGLGAAVWPMQKLEAIGDFHGRHTVKAVCHRCGGDWGDVMGGVVAHVLAGDCG